MCEDIDGAPVSCTVTQFLQILEEVASCPGNIDLVWFGADMSPNAFNPGDSAFVLRRNI